jgi:hypothetical protein
MKKRIEAKTKLFEELRKEFPELEVLSDHELDLKVFQAPSTIRLRPFGFTLLKDLFDCYEFELQERLTGRELLALKNYVGLPYFLPVNGKRIFIFSAKSAFRLKLGGGDVKKWLNSMISAN